MNDAAPITQLLLTVQFAAPVQNLTLFDLADLRGVFTEYPVYQQTMRAGAMPVLQPRVTVPAFISTAPRIQLLTDDLQWNILFQEDRVSVGWNRTAALDEPAGYPGFTAVLDRLSDVLGTLSDHFVRAGGEPLVAGVGEVVYSDAFRLDLPGGGRKRLEDMFANVRSNSDFKFSFLDITYARVEENDYPSHVELNINGPGSDPAGEVVMLLETTARFEAGGSDTYVGRFQRAHDSAREMFDFVVKPEAVTQLDPKT